MMHRSSYLNFLAAAACIVICDVGQPALAQSDSVEALREARSFFALPLELDIDRGAANGNAAIFRIMPLYSFPLGDSWKVASLTILTLADAPGTPAFPGEPGASKTTGVSDLLHASFFEPDRSGNLIWGIGPMNITAYLINQTINQIFCIPVVQKQAALGHKAI